MKTKSLDRVEFLGNGIALIAMLCCSLEVYVQVTRPLVLLVAVVMLIVTVIGYIKSKKRYRKDILEKDLMSIRKISLFLYIGVFFLYGTPYFQHPIYLTLGIICLAIVGIMIFKQEFVNKSTK